MVPINIVHSETYEKGSKGTLPCSRVFPKIAEELPQRLATLQSAL